MRGRPPVAGLRAVVVAMMLAALPFGAVLAEQIRPTLPGVGAKPKPVQKARRPFRPTLPQRNPTRVSADIVAAIKVDATASPLSASGAAAAGMAGASTSASVAIPGEDIPAQDPVAVAAAEPASAPETTAAVSDDGDTPPAEAPSDAEETASPGTDAAPASAGVATPTDATDASSDMTAEATPGETTDPAEDQAAAETGSDIPAGEADKTEEADKTDDKTEETAATEPEETPAEEGAEQQASAAADVTPSDEAPAEPAEAAETPAALPETEKPEPVDTAGSESETPEETGALATTEPAAGIKPAAGEFTAGEAAEEPTDQAITEPAAPKETARLESDPSPPKETARLDAEAVPADAEPVAEVVAAEPPAAPEPEVVEAKPVKSAVPSHDATVVIDVLPPPAAIAAAAAVAPTGPEAPAAESATMEMAAVTPPSEPTPAPAIPAVEETPADADADDASTGAQAAPGSEEATPAETPPEETPSAETATETMPDADADADAAPPAVAEDAAAPEDAASPPEAAAVEAAPPPPPAHPVVAAIRDKLADPAFRKGINAATLEGLEEFYGAREGPPLWIADGGFSPEAQALITAIGNADDWGLDARDFDAPKADTRAATEDEQAAAELDLAMAVLKYARYAQGGARSPSSFSPLFDQRPELRGTKTLLTEIAAAPEPAGYLTSLHPQHAQFKALRAALVKARARAAANGRNPRSDGEVQLLVINMERWRWLPRNLGSYHVWNNVPEFNVRVMKGGKPIYVEKTIVGQDKYATPFFSAPMRNIVFHPNWTVPPTIVKEDLAPKLQAPSGLFSPSKTDTLRRYGLSVSYKGEPIDADSVDWANVNIHTYTFTQDPGPTNVLGKFKFNFPNRHAIYMHDTVQPELFSERIRTLSHGCIRVHEPDRFAALLLAEDKGWSYAQIQRLVDKDASTVIALNHKIPVHLTYFTATIDENGGLNRFADIYGIDNRMAAKLFENPARFPVPSTPAVVEQSQSNDRDRSARRRGGGGGLDDLISGLFGN